MSIYDINTDALPTCDNDCTLLGWTEMVLSSDAYELHVSVAPQTDIEGVFIAFDHDEQELIKVKGWLFALEWFEAA